MVTFLPRRSWPVRAQFEGAIEAAKFVDNPFCLAYRPPTLALRQRVLSA